MYQIEIKGNWGEIDLSPMGSLSQVDASEVAHLLAQYSVDAALGYLEAALVASVPVEGEIHPARAIADGDENPSAVWAVTPGGVTVQFYPLDEPEAGEPSGNTTVTVGFGRESYYLAALLLLANQQCNVRVDGEGEWRPVAGFLTVLLGGEDEWTGSASE